MQGGLDCHLEARLQSRNQVFVVHVKDGEVNAFDQSFLFDDHIALDDAIKCNANDHIGVQDMTAQIVKELNHAEGRSLNG